MSKKIQDKYQEATNNYKNEIEELTRFVDIVRKMPGMYIGPVGVQGFLNMIREIFQNCGDQLSRQDSPCDHIIFSYDESTNTVIIEDNGFGIPFGMMKDLFSKQHISSNYTKTKFKFSSGRHGIGSKVTNMLSRFFIVQSYSAADGIGHEVKFEEGICVEDEHEIPNPENKQGTVVIFAPSDYMWEENKKSGIEDYPTLELVYNFICSLIPQLELNSTIVFNGIGNNGEEIHEVIVNDRGIYTHIDAMAPNRIIEPIHIFDNTDGIHKAEILFTYDATAIQSPYIISFANTCPVTNKSTHVIGFENGVVSWFRKYMNNIYLANSKKASKIQITAQDIKEGLVAVLSVFHLEPNFEGQAKDALSNADMNKYVYDLVCNGLDQWSKTNAKDLNTICDYIKNIAIIRSKQSEEKIKLVDNFKSSSITGMPKKYTRPSGKEHLELFIVEGDSANGIAKQARCKKRQGTFPIRGKIPNALTTERVKFINNQEISSLITIIGGGYGKNFNIDKVMWEKIIAAADADPDGKHICNLLLIFFMVYMPKLIIDGRFYKAVPPLYGVNLGTPKKPNFKYFVSRLDFSQYVQALFSKNHQLSTTTGILLTDNDAISLIYRNIMYVYELELICKRYALNPFLLESTISLLYQPFDIMKQELENKFRFINVSKNGNHVIIKGLVDRKSQTLILNDTFINDAKHIIDLIHVENNNNLYYRMDGEIVSMYKLMKTYDESNPSNIKRFKGLGEMNEDQLKESTFDPDGDRTLIRYTFDDAVKEIEQIKYIQSNKDQLLNRINVSRYELLG